LKPGQWPPKWHHRGTVRRIWHAHGLKPHLLDSFKISKDKRFAAYSGRSE
jgi:hypothetical protein